MGNQAPTFAWRVLACDPRGPCKDTNVVPFFEYIIGIDGRRLDGVAVSMKEILEGAVNKPTELTLLNYMTKATRTVEVCPSRDWGGVGLLGLIIANDDYQQAAEHTVRVLNVFPESPASKAGLHPFVDYILGTENKIFKGIDGLENHILANVGNDIRLRVYNSNLLQVREVILRPGREWDKNGGSGGLLGCEVGSGILHKIPDLLPGNKITAHEGTKAEFVMSGNGILVTPSTNTPEDVPTPTVNGAPDALGTDDLGPIAFGQRIDSIYNNKKEPNHGSSLVQSVAQSMEEPVPEKPPQIPTATSGTPPIPEEAGQPSEAKGHHRRKPSGDVLGECAQQVGPAE